MVHQFTILYSQINFHQFWSCPAFVSTKQSSDHLRFDFFSMLAERLAPRVIDKIPPFLPSLIVEKNGWMVWYGLIIWYIHWNVLDQWLEPWLSGQERQHQKHGQLHTTSKRRRDFQRIPDLMGLIFSEGQISSKSLKATCSIHVDHDVDFSNQWHSISHRMVKVAPVHHLSIALFNQLL